MRCSCKGSICLRTGKNLDGLFLKLGALLASFSLILKHQASLKALVAELSSEVGGLSVRYSPTGWKQAQGAVGVI